MAKIERPPVQLDHSAGAQQYLQIWYEYNEHVTSPHHYEITVKDDAGTPLPGCPISSTEIVDRTSLAILVAQHIAKDERFAFGMDSQPYWWAGNHWKKAEKWMRSLDFSMHALAHTGHQKRDANSLSALTMAAWRAITDYPLEGVDLRPFGKGKGIPFEDFLVTDMGPGRRYAARAHEPKNGNTRVLPITFNAALKALEILESGAADDSLLMKFLRSSLDDVQFELLQRWFGYHLVMNAVPNAEKMLFMWGKGGNGKGQILWLIRELVGEDACAELQLADLETPSTLELLINAVAMIGGEATTDTEKETLKRLISREPMTCRPKYRDPYRIKPECLITQASNPAPAFDDKSDAMMRRVIAIELTKSFTDELTKVEDVAFQIAAREYPLLAGFALGGAFKIMETGRFSVPAAIAEKSNVLVASGNPYEQFGKRLEYGPYEVSIAELYIAYKRWVLDEDKGKPDSKREFQMHIERQFAKSKAEVVENRSQGYTPSRWSLNGINALVAPDMKGKRPAVYQGVRLNDGDHVVGQDWLGRRSALRVA